MLLSCGVYEEALGWDEDPCGPSSFAELFSSLSLRLKPRRIGPLFRNDPVMGARLTRVDPGGAAASAEAFRDLAAAEVPYLDTASDPCCADVLRATSDLEFVLSFVSGAVLASLREPGLL